MARNLLLILSNLLIASFVSAGQPTDEKQVVSVQFIASPGVENQPPLKLLVKGSDSIGIQLSTNRLSPVYKVPPQAEWILGRAMPGEQGQSLRFEVAGRTDAPPARRQIVIVVRDADQAEDRLTLIALAAGEHAFSAGDYLFFNGSNRGLGGQLGDRKFIIEAGQHAIISPEASVEGANQSRLPTRFFYGNDRQDRPFYSSTWRLGDQTRNLVFFYQTPLREQVRIHTVRDYIR